MKCVSKVMGARKEETGHTEAVEWKRGVVKVVFVRHEQLKKWTNKKGGVGGETLKVRGRLGGQYKGEREGG